MGTETKPTPDGEARKMFGGTRPCVGLVVHYWPRPKDNLRVPGPLAAIITRYNEGTERGHPAGTMALHVLLPPAPFDWKKGTASPSAMRRGAVPYEGVSDPPVPGTWRWADECPLFPTAVPSQGADTGDVEDDGHTDDRD